MGQTDTVVRNLSCLPVSFIPVFYISGIRYLLNRNYFLTINSLLLICVLRLYCAKMSCFIVKSVGFTAQVMKCAAVLSSGTSFFLRVV